MRHMFIAIMAVLMAGQAAAKDVLSGASLYEDVTRYASFGLHRFGSPGDRATGEWIAAELKAAGFEVRSQPVVLGCVCERGPGIANFLALARTVAAEKWPAHVVFIATAGHEIGHGGMELFLKNGAPAPKETLAWIHFGSSNACYAFAEGARTDRPEEERYLVLSKSAVALTDEAFAKVGAKRLVTEKQAVGELRDVHAAGYANFLGMAGRHRTFHTPSDDLAATGPELLEPVARAFVQAARKIVERGNAAFR
jgi:hypothetical protein